MRRQFGRRKLRRSATGCYSPRRFGGRPRESVAPENVMEVTSPAVIWLRRLIVIAYCILIFLLSVLFVPWQNVAAESESYGAVGYAPIWAPPLAADQMVTVDFNRVMMFAIALTIIAGCAYHVVGASDDRMSGCWYDIETDGLFMGIRRLFSRCDSDLKILGSFGIVLGLLYGIGIGVVYRVPLILSFSVSFAGAVFWAVCWAAYPSISFRDRLVGATLAGIAGGAINQSLIIALIDGIKIDVLIGTTFVGGVLGGAVGFTAGLIILPLFYCGKQFVRIE